MRAHLLAIGLDLNALRNNEAMDELVILRSQRASPQRRGRPASAPGVEQRAIHRAHAVGNYDRMFEQHFMTLKDRSSDYQFGPLSRNLVIPTPGVWRKRSRGDDPDHRRPHPRDRIIAVIESLTPAILSKNRFLRFRNEEGGDFAKWCLAHPEASLRRFQVRDDGTDPTPLVTNCSVDEKMITFFISVAYPQTDRAGGKGALDRDTAMTSA